MSENFQPIILTLSLENMLQLQMIYLRL